MPQAELPLDCIALPSYNAMSSNAHQYPAMLSNQFSMEKQLLGLKLVKFCYFRSLNNHGNAYKVVKIAKWTSAATLRPKKHKNKKLLVSTKIPLCCFNHFLKTLFSKNVPNFCRLAIISVYKISKFPLSMLIFMQKSH